MRDVSPRGIASKAKSPSKLLSLPSALPELLPELPFPLGCWVGLKEGGLVFPACCWVGLKEGGLVFPALPFPFMDE